MKTKYLCFFRSSFKPLGWIFHNVQLILLSSENTLRSTKNTKKKLAYSSTYNNARQNQPQTHIKKVCRVQKPLFRFHSVCKFHSKKVGRRERWMEERKCQDSASFTGTQSPEEGMVGDGRDEKPHRGQAPTRENHLEGGVSRTAFFVFTSFTLSTFSFPISQ